MNKVEIQKTKLKQAKSKRVKVQKTQGETQKGSGLNTKNNTRTDKDREKTQGLSRQKTNQTQVGKQRQVKIINDQKRAGKKNKDRK